MNYSRGRASKDDVLTAYSMLAEGKTWDDVEEATERRRETIEKRRKELEEEAAAKEALKETKKAKEAVKEAFREKSSDYIETEVEATIIVTLAGRFNVNQSKGQTLDSLTEGAIEHLQMNASCTSDIEDLLHNPEVGVAFVDVDVHSIAVL